MAERESVVVSVSSTGVRVVRRDIESIGRASDSTESSVQLLRRGLGALFGLFAANQIRETLDSFTTMQNRIRALGNSVQTTTAIYNELLKTAMDSRTSLAASVTIYQRLAQSTEHLGISQRDVIEITDTLNKAVIVSGASAIEARNAMIQLAQGMASGRLQGDELRSVLEQLPYVARLISRQTGIEFGNIRDAAAEGKITVDQIVAALKNYRGEVLAAFAQTTPTIEQALTNLNTGWTDYAGKLGQATGVTNAIANSILFVANNMQTLIPIAISAGVAVAGAFTPQLVGVLAAVNGQLVRMVTLLAANPLVALAGAAAALTTYLVLMRDELKLGNDEITTLGDAFGPMWRDAQQGALDLVNVLDSGPIPGLKRVQEAIDDITFLDILVSLANTTDELIRIWGGVLAVMDTLWTRFVAALGPRLIDQLNPALQGLSDVFNYEPPWFKKIRELAGLEESKQFFDFTIDLPTPEDMANSGRDLGEAFRSGYNLAAVDNGNPAADYIAGIVDEASVNSQLRMFQNVTNKLFGGLDRTGSGGGGGGGGGSDKAAEKIRKLFDRTTAGLKEQINLVQTRLGQEEELTGLQELNAKMTYGDLAKLNDYQKERLTGLQMELDKLNELQRVRDTYINRNSLGPLFRDQEVANGIQGPEGAIAQQGVNKAIQDQVFQGRPQVQGIDASVGGAFGELNRLEEERSKLEQWYEERAEMYRNFQETRVGDAERYGKILTQIEEARQKDERNLDVQMQTAKLQGYSEMFGQLAGLTAMFAGENAGITRALVAFQQTAALASSIVNIQAGLAQAAANPFPYNIAAMASVAAATAGIVTTIAGVNVPSAPSFSGNFDTGGNIPRGSYGVVGEYGPEIVSGPANVRGRQSTADYMSRNSTDGATFPINIYPNDPGVSEEEGATAQQQDDGTLDIRIAALVTKGGTRTDKAFRTSYNVNRKGTK